MPNQHKNPLLGWNPSSAEDAAWVRAEAERRGGRAVGALARLLDEALADLRAKHAAPVAAPEQPQQAGKNCKHRNMRMSKGVCPDCQEWVTK